MSLLTPSDTQSIQQLLNHMSVALTEILAMTEATKAQLSALTNHNVSKSSHHDIRDDIVCVREEVTSLMPTVHTGGVYTGPVVMTISEEGGISNLGFIDPNAVPAPPEPTPSVTNV